MRKLTIALMIVLCVLWAGAVWADEKDDHEEGFAPVPQTGQVTSFDANTPKRDDGALQKGVELPTPRFTDQGTGTIKDNLTGLIWLKNANCPNSVRNWQQALNDVVSLNTTGKMNNNNCEDKSGKRGSHRTDWRLPNIRELFSLVDFAFFDPALSNAKGDGTCIPTDCAFSNFQASGYWSSTTNLGETTSAGPMSTAWFVSFFEGRVFSVVKSDGAGFVLAVRGGAED